MSLEEGTNTIGSALSVFSCLHEYVIWKDLPLDIVRFWWDQQVRRV